MPLLKIDHIHVANNILSTDSSKKWKCRMAGEKNAIIVLQLEKASVITGIDIGNEHSAYVEILVSRSENNEEYKVLLTMCSFMTPVESRQSQNINKVRMFGKDDLSKPECDEKWDRVKIVCTQPFNKHVQYGLNFIKLHSNDDKTQVPMQNTIGKFSLRPESPDNLSIGSIFSKQKQVKQEEKLTELPVKNSFIRNRTSGGRLLSPNDNQQTEWGKTQKLILSTLPSSIKSVKLVAITIDEQLTWKNFMEFLSKKLSILSS